ncbi:ATP-binding protein [Streptomyces sp. NPDC051217]|uniref:ATP-binding protein n=1 Tax=Streptomyces sp. NPDC051217 TaxID=3365644 RepID=UPI00379C2E47
MGDALLVVSELVTNAVTATGPNMTTPTWTDVKADHILGVQLRVVAMHLYVEAWDRSDEAPRTKSPPADAEDGRGILLVEALTKRWGTYRPPAGGKVVWAELPLINAPTLTQEVPTLPHRVPSDVRVPNGRVREQVETALMERGLEGVRRR